jgi:hypothetical protein
MANVDTDSDIDWMACELSALCAATTFPLRVTNPLQWRKIGAVTRGVGDCL